MSWLNKLWREKVEAKMCELEETRISCKLPSFLDGVAPQLEQSHEPGVTESDLVFQVPAGGEFAIFRHPGRKLQGDYKRALHTWLLLVGSATKTICAFTLQGQWESVHCVINEDTVNARVAEAYGHAGLFEGQLCTSFYAYLPFAGIKFDCLAPSKFVKEHLGQIRECATSLADTRDNRTPNFSFSVNFDKEHGVISLD